MKENCVIMKEKFLKVVCFFEEGKHTIAFGAFMRSYQFILISLIVIHHLCIRNVKLVSTVTTQAEDM